MKAIPWWAVAAASAAPVLLIGGFLVAAAMQPASYNPVRDTISELAGQGATNVWVMTSALLGVGLCYLLSALGLYPAGRFGRALLAGGGVATLLIVVLRQPRHGYSLGHELAVIAAALTCCTWPAFAWRQQHPAPLLRPIPSVAAAGGSIGLATWYALESHGALLGLAERCAAAAVPLWLLAVVVTTRRALTQGTGAATHRAAQAHALRECSALPPGERSSDEVRVHRDCRSAWNPTRSPLRAHVLCHEEQGGPDAQNNSP